MYVFNGENMRVSIYEGQIKEVVLYNDSLCIELYNKTRIRIDGEYEKLTEVFKTLKKKNKNGNFINIFESQVEIDKEEV